jgi:hypothetical protein
MSVRIVHGFRTVDMLIADVPISKKTECMAVRQQFVLCSRFDINIVPAQFNEYPTNIAD